MSKQANEYPLPNHQAMIDELGVLMQGKKPEEALGLGNERMGLFQGVFMSAGGIAVLLIAFTFLPLMLAGTVEDQPAAKKSTEKEAAKKTEKETAPEKKTAATEPKIPANPVLKDITETKKGKKPANPFANPDDDLFNLKKKKR